MPLWSAGVRRAPDRRVYRAGARLRRVTDKAPDEVLFSGQDQVSGSSRAPGAGRSGRWRCSSCSRASATRSRSPASAAARRSRRCSSASRRASWPRSCPGFDLTPASPSGSARRRRGPADPAVGGRPRGAADVDDGLGRRRSSSSASSSPTSSRCSCSTARPRRRSAGGAPGDASAPGGTGRSARRPGRLQQRGHQLADRRRLDAAVAQDPAAGARHGVVQGARPDVLDEHGGDGAAGSSEAARPRSAPARSRSAWSPRRALGGLAPFGGVEPEAEQRRDRAPREPRPCRSTATSSSLSASRWTKRTSSTRSVPPLSSRCRAPTRPPPKSAPRSKPKTSSCAGGPARSAIRRWVRGRRRVRGREQRVPGPGRRDDPSWDWRRRAA